MTTNGCPMQGCPTTLIRLYREENMNMSLCQDYTRTIVKSTLTRSIVAPFSKKYSVISLCPAPADRC